MKSSYTLFARMFPTALSIIPILVLLNLHVDFNSIIGYINESISFIGLNIAASTLLMFILSQLLRYIGKDIIENRIFNDGDTFPTTLMLKKNDESISKLLKHRIITNIKEDFSIDLTDVIDEEEVKAIKDSVSLIRKKVGNGKLVINRNIEYGFFRNLIAGCPIIVITCISLILTERTIAVFVIFGIYGVICLILLTFAKPLLWFYAKQYAQQLYSEYIG